MQRAVKLVCNVFVATSLVACAADGMDGDTAEEDAVADAAGDGKSDAPEFPLGLYHAFDIDHEEGEALHAAFHQDGSADFTKFINDSETRYYQGFFKAYKYRGRDRLRITDVDGKVILRADWGFDEDDDLEFAGEQWLKGTPDLDDPKLIASCTAFHVGNTELFEEGFTEYEYPDVSIEKSGTSYSIQLGSGGLDPSDGPVDFKQGARELVVKQVLGGDETIEIKIQNEPPRRGVINFADNPGDPLTLMANIVCR